MTKLFAILSLSLFTASLAIAAELSDSQKERLVSAIDKRLQKSAYAYGIDFGDWSRHANKHRASIDAAKTKEELQNALHDALDEFKISHLGITSPSKAKMQRSGRRTGIGISIQEVEDGLFVTYVIRGGPAWASGIRKGDTITHIDDKPLENISQLIGEVGDLKQFTWIHNDQEFEEILEYEPFPLAEKSSMRWLSDEVALIKIQSFQFRFYNFNRINRYVKEARTAKAIIIDLRNNRGGLSIYSQHLASKFSPKKDVFSRMINRPRFKKLSRSIDTDNLQQLAKNAKKIRPLPFSKPYTGKVVVLVDNLSASGADIFPAFIKESNRGIIIGDKTAGALQLARNFRLPYGFRLYTPIAEILTPNGNRLEGDGLEPNVKFKFRETANDKVMFRAAFEALRLEVPENL